MTRTHVVTDDRPSLTDTFSTMFSMSWPIMLGTVVMALLHTGQTGLLGNLDDTQPLYLLSRLQPWYLLFFAFLEALGITSQVFSAKSCRAWPKGGVKIAVLLLTAIAAAIMGGLSVGVSLGSMFLTDVIAVIDAPTAAVLPAYLLSLSPFILFDILNGSLRGQGRTLPGFIVLTVTLVMNLGLCHYLLAYKQMSFDALLIANLVSGSIAALLMLPIFLLQLRAAEPTPLVVSMTRTSMLLGVVGTPVFLSMVVSFFSSIVLFDQVSALGAEYSSGFLLAIRIRFFALIPATALATSLAVMLNQGDGPDAATLRRARLLQGALCVISIYLAITAGAYLLREQIVDLLAEDVTVRHAALSILNFLLPSYMVVAMVVFSHVILENLGRGTRVLLWTVLLESATCYGLIHYANRITESVHVILAATAAYGVVFTIEYLLLVRRQTQTINAEAVPA